LSPEKSPAKDCLTKVMGGKLDKPEMLSRQESIKGKNRANLLNIEREGK